MTLRELRAAHPHLFHPNQDWFEDEPFMDVPILEPVRLPVGRRITGAAIPGGPLPSAGQLAAAYVMTPQLVLWWDYLWTSDTDSQCQRVYVGGTANGKGFEIHRHLHLTERWGVPQWT